MSKSMLSAFTRLMETDEISENGAIQTLFDLLFFITLLETDASAAADVVKLVESKVLLPLP